MSNHPGPFAVRHITPSPSPETVEAFYDRALFAAFQGAMADPALSCEEAALAALDGAGRLTERRFNVKLVLPGDGE